jgi:NADH-ubiquinone oxidoreductase chain 2
MYVYENKQDKENLIDRNNSPIQLINQIKGYFYINTFISISFAITVFSFIGIPPLIGFFAKQMILSAALDSGYIFMSLIAIITSVVGAGYYLNLIKQVFFYKSDYQKNISINNINITGYIVPNRYNYNKTSLHKYTTKFIPENVTINSAISSSISVITLLLVLFIFVPEQWLNIIGILSLIQFKA